jgi:hypothetical protein
MDLPNYRISSHPSIFILRVRHLLAKKNSIMRLQYSTNFSLQFYYHQFGVQMAVCNSLHNVIITVLVNFTTMFTNILILS